ncbi:serine/threonine protein kinase [Chitinophaga skermanii]|uniref:Serine/threonine protein kinase n=1 Tax=Chitinophaga skermanii TaxID=331697 RepID=A0A327QQ00_9BACT|nr:lanthionine synthetase LanC family protein [Chitinophaga skermanii]RAJ06696.1 serine/threonine protein kinase [Chitinophaga skermanii]
MSTEQLSKIRDYKVFLLEYFNEFDEESEDIYYIIHGDLRKTQGWMYYISCNLVSITSILPPLLQYLKSIEVAFKLIKTREDHININNAVLGVSTQGQAIVIYPNDDKQARSIYPFLYEILGNEEGPVISAAQQLTNSIYTRYGGIKPIPVLQENGEYLHFIYDINGNLVEDLFTIPHVLPSGVDRLFPIVQSKDKGSAVNKIVGNYLPFKVLKNDLKGSVHKAIYFKGLLSWGVCVLKQGKKNVWQDAHNRDVTSRIRWQKQLFDALRGKVKMPVIYEYFEDNTDAYIAMELVKGKSFMDEIFEVYNGRTWHNIPQNGKIKLLEITLKILALIECMHNCDFVHRDITPTNFIVDKKLNVQMIDLELSYDLQSAELQFDWGTPGFMSPNQYYLKTPTIEDDLYAIGASLFVVLTGQFPIILSRDHELNLHRKLSYYIPNKEIRDVVFYCLHDDPQQRPSLQYIINAVQYFKLLIQKDGGGEALVDLVSRKDIETTIQHAISTVNSPMFTGHQTWFSRKIFGNGHVKGQFDGARLYYGFNRGAAGVFYMLHIAKSVGFNIDEGLRVAEKIPVAIETKEFPNGLHFGKAGIAIMLNLMNQYSCFNNISDYNLVEWMTGIVTKTDLVFGYAGQLLALLHLHQQNRAAYVNAKIDEIVTVLRESQLESGAWYNDTTNSNKQINTGLHYGVAGILYSLLLYRELYHDTQVDECIITGLQWLEKTSFSRNGTRFWRTSTHDMKSTIELCTGASGIALVFIVAYRVYKSDKYKKIVDEAFMCIPHEFVMLNLSHCHGSAGIGEVYLEAYRAFNDAAYLEKAEKIVLSIIHQVAATPNPNEVYWYVEGTEFPTADFMTGQAGVIHFLLRYLHPDKIPYPLEPQP